MSYFIPVSVSFTQLEYPILPVPFSSTFRRETFQLLIFYVDQIPSKLEQTFPPIPYSVNLNAKLQPSFSPIVLSCILRPRGSRIVVKGFTGGQISGESRIVGGGRSRQAIDRVCSRVAGRSGAGVGVAMVGKVHSVCTSRPYMQLAGKRIAGGDAVV